MQDRVTPAELIQGKDKVMETVSSFVSSADTRIDACVDQSRPAVSMETDQIRKLIISAHSRGVKLRCITEITASNLDSCKQLLEIVDELRHLDGISGSFYVSDKECLVHVFVHEKGKPASQLIYWNAREAVIQQQRVYETLWNKATIAQQKN